MELEGQKVAMYWNGKPIGILVSRIAEPYDGVFETVWEGWCLGEHVRPTESLLRAESRLGRIASKRGLHTFRFDNGAEVTELAVPAMEE